jgi:hypothetical protein
MNKNRVVILALREFIAESVSDADDTRNEPTEVQRLEAPLP